MTHFHIFTVKYLGATNYRSSRVKITSSRFKDSVTISYDHALNNVEEMAAAYLTLKGFNVLGTGDSCVVTDTFDSLKSH